MNGETVRTRRPVAHPRRSSATTPRTPSPAPQFDPRRILGNQAIARHAAAAASGDSVWSPAVLEGSHGDAARIPILLRRRCGAAVDSRRPTPAGRCAPKHRTGAGPAYSGHVTLGMGMHAAIGAAGGAAVAGAHGLGSRLRWRHQQTPWEQIDAAASNPREVHGEPQPGFDPVPNQADGPDPTGSGGSAGEPAGGGNSAPAAGATSSPGVAVAASSALATRQPG